ncbi:unnamed protein product [Rotaria sp. Silwood2]|nr:unnamed protein product [Rotaria sp. Silwood2]CAF2950687.1 unnamed protein product [Rotaria sp. Silwood2]CAF3282982.1 unnamed protein product [Rotaria sp. Silwood2]CAF4114055.1 unnamed protein product [Rotaria sp. Silwood2]CAF4148549.1 unnamed protein product [Rotaria sp. Silwood2]
MHLITKDPISNQNDDLKVEPMEVSNSMENEKLQVNIPTTYAAHLERQQYCFIIFNNPRWSQIVKNKSSNIPREHAATVKQEPTQTTFDWPTQMFVKNETFDLTLDEQFVAKLRQLIDEYMKHTTRPLPLKYFLDLTEQ